MEYGLRRYEATRRLTWFVFFLLCLALASSMADWYEASHPQASPSLQSPPQQTERLGAGSGARDKAAPAVPGVRPEELKSADFWTRCRWIGLEPMGWLLTYIACVAVLFLAGRLLWLLVQFGGEIMVKRMLTGTIRPGASKPNPLTSKLPPSPERLFPAERLRSKVDFLPLQLLFHPFQRLKLMLVKTPRSTLSSAELMEKERRIVETDWQILYNSWAPFRWLLWFLPALALAQTCWMLYLYLHPALTGQKEMQEIFGYVLHSLVPLIQAILLAIVLKLASTLLVRIEDLYLSNVDAMLYDQFISQLPFQSSDTVIMLEALQHHFNEINATLRRIEHSFIPEEKEAREEST